MALFNKRKTPHVMTRDQALACIPIHNNVISWTEIESGVVRIEYHMVLKPFLQSIFKRFSRTDTETKPIKKIELDAMGSTVWRMIDGNRSVSEIISIFALAQKISDDEAEKSITVFLRELGKRGLIGLR